MAKRRVKMDRIHETRLAEGIKHGGLTDFYVVASYFRDPGDLEEHIKKLKKVLENGKALGYRKIRVDLFVDHDDEIGVEFNGERFETGAEKKLREETAAKRAVSSKLARANASKRKAEKEFAEFERLRKKFGE